MSNRPGLTGTITLTPKDWDLLTVTLRVSNDRRVLPIVDAIDGAYAEAVRSKELARINMAKRRKVEAERLKGIGGHTL